MDLLKRAEETAATIRNEDGVRLRADCLRVMGSFARMRSKRDSSSYYEQAYELYKEIGDELGQTHCIRSCADKLRTESEFISASEKYKTAISKYKNILEGANTHEDPEMARDTRRGLANCIEILGDIAHMARVDGTKKSLADAEDRYREALSIYTEIEDLIGQANCSKGSGDVFMACNETEQAQEFYARAKDNTRRVATK